MIEPIAAPGMAPTPPNRAPMAVPAFFFIKIQKI